MLADLPGPLGIVCHDAGGANQIFAALERCPGLEVRAHMAGPALALWRGAFPDRPLVAELPELLPGLATLVTGTGWASDLEHEARRRARALGLRNVAVLDHWTNYAMRFVRYGETVLPDEIRVVDAEARRLAEEVFPGLPVVQVADAYAEAQLRAVAPVPPPERGALLYLLEPMRDDWGRGIPGEFQALDYLFGRLGALGLPAGAPIRLRPHPSDPPGKYADYLGRRAGHAVTLDTGSLAMALEQARWVAGCQTYALTLALRAGREVICTLPPWAPSCVLPHGGLRHLREFESEI